MDGSTNARNYQDVWWIVFPLLILWWIPLLIGSVFGLLNRPGAAATAATAESPAPAAGTGIITGGLYSITQSLARIARDAFIAILFGLMLSQVLSGGMDHGVWASAWAAFAFVIVWWLLALFVGWIPVVGPLGGGLFGFGFVVSILTLYAHVFKYYRQTVWWST